MAFTLFVLLNIISFVAGVDNNNVRKPLTSQQTKCPPAGFDALKKFDFTSYISAPWYSVKQTPLVYQPVNNLFCVRADYIPNAGFCPLCLGRNTIQIYNQAREGGVNVPKGGNPYNPASPMTTNFFRGVQNDPVGNPAKLTVGYAAPILPRPFYWVVAAGTYDDAFDGVAKPSTNNYEWAIISGGSPAVPTTNGKCIPTNGDVNGIWFFARDPVPPSGVITAIEKIAQSLGLDTGGMLAVGQKGCIY